MTDAPTGDESYITRIKDLTKRYGDRTVLKIDDLLLERGRRYALIGANGSGKSTLLRIAAGTLEPSEGNIDTKAISIGYMPQKPYIFGFTVFKNVAMAASANASGDVEARALSALEAVDMQDFKDEYGESLSGGEAQRVAFARILAGDHDLLLLDEPTSAMDIEGTAFIGTLIDYYCEKTGCTVVFTTHAPSQALGIADDLIFLHKGSIAETGPCEEVLKHPKSEPAQKFLSYWKF